MSFNIKWISIYLYYYECQLFQCQIKIWNCTICLYFYNFKNQIKKMQFDPTTCDDQTMEKLAVLQFKLETAGFLISTTLILAGLVVVSIMFFDYLI